MSGPRMGLLLSSQTLTEPWFLVLATFVAFNTIIYLGLTLAKLIPWPAQFHPSQVRTWLGRDAQPEENVMRPAAHETGFAATSIRRGIPQAFALTGGLTILLSLVSLIAYPGTPLTQRILQFAFGAALLLIGLTFVRLRPPIAVLTWGWAIASILLAGLMLLDAVEDVTLLGLVYAVIVMTAFAPIVQAWAPALSAGAVMLFGSVAVIVSSDIEEPAPWIVACAAALLTSLALLQMRLTTIRGLEHERERANALATTDPLTGLLSRQGLIGLVEHLAANAEADAQQVRVLVVRIADLARANADYGTAYGDDVLRAVALTIDEVLPEGDLLARWDGDTFLAFGIKRRSGKEESADVRAAVDRLSIDFGKWPIAVRVGSAKGRPDETTFEGLTAEAEQQVA